MIDIFMTAFILLSLMVIGVMVIALILAVVIKMMGLHDER